MKTLPLIASCLALGFLGGCAEGPSVPVSDAASPETAGAPVVLLDAGLKNAVAVDLLRTGPNENGYLTVQASLRNRTNDDQRVQVQALFFTATGAVLNDEPGNPAAWTTLVLSANETVPYRSQAINKAARRATVRVRFLHRPSDS